MTTLLKKDRYANTASSGAASAARNAAIKGASVIPTPKNTHFFQKSKSGGRKNSTTTGADSSGEGTGKCGPNKNGKNLADDVIVLDDEDDLDAKDLTAKDEAVADNATNQSSTDDTKGPPIPPRKRVATGSNLTNTSASGKGPVGASGRPLPNIPQTEGIDLGLDDTDLMDTSSLLGDSSDRPKIKRSQSENESVGSASHTADWVHAKQIADLQEKVDQKQQEIDELLSDKIRTSEKDELLRTQGDALRRDDAIKADRNDKIHQQAERIANLEKVVRERDATVRDQQKKVNEQLDKIWRLSDRIKLQKKHLTDFNTQIQRNNEDMQSLNAYIQQQEDQAEDQAQRNKDLERQWKKAIGELSRLKQQGVVHKVDDDSLKARYETVLYHSRTWGQTYCGSQAGRMTFGSKEIECLKELIVEKDIARYLSSQTLRPVLMQSLIMHILWNDVLSKRAGGGSVWAGDLAASLNQLDGKLRLGESYDLPVLLKNQKIRPMDVREYCAWRAKTALLISDGVERNHERSQVDAKVEEILEKLKTALEPFLTTRAQGMWNELRTAIAEAVELDEEVHKSKAAFAFSKWSGPTRQGWGFVYDGATMESAVGFEAGRPGLSVELVVAPFFVKVGTADGESYDMQSYLSKCVVVCTEPSSRKKGDR